MLQIPDTDLLTAFLTEFGKLVGKLRELPLQSGDCGFVQLVVLFEGVQAAVLLLDDFRLRFENLMVQPHLGYEGGVLLK